MSYLKKYDINENLQRLSDNSDTKILINYSGTIHNYPDHKSDVPLEISLQVIQKFGFHNF